MDIDIYSSKRSVSEPGTIKKHGIFIVNTLFQVKKNKVIIFASLALIVLFSVSYLLLTNKIHNSEWTEIGIVNMPKLVTKTYFLKGSAGEYDISSVQYSSNYKYLAPVAVRVILDTQKYTYFVQGNKLNKYLKDTNQVNTVQVPVDLGFDINASLIKTDLAFFSFSNQAYEPSVYLVDLTTDTFRKVDSYSEKCGLYCASAMFISLIDPNNVLVDQGDGDACWGTDTISKMNLTNLLVSPIGTFETGCRNSGDVSNSFIGAQGSKLITSSFIYNYDESTTTYKTLDATDLNNNQKTVLLNSSTMPQNIKYIEVTSNGLILLFDTDNSGYIYDLSNNKISSSSDLTSKQDTLANLDTVIVSRQNETSLTGLKRVTIDKSINPSYGDPNIPQGIFLTDKNNLTVELMSVRDWRGMYNKGRGFNHMNDVPGICENNAVYEMADLKTGKNVIYATVKVTFHNSYQVDCTEFATSGENPSHLETKIDLITGKVYLKNQAN